MNRLKKIGVILLSICMFCLVFQSEALAASCSVKVSSASGNVGSTVKITCTASASGTSIGAADVSLKYDPSSLKVQSCSSGASGTGGGIYYSGWADSSGMSSLSFTVTFQILKEGTHAVTIQSAEVSDYESVQAIGTPSKSNGSVTGKVPSSNTNNNNNNNTNNNTSNNNTQQDSRDKNNKLSSLQVYPGTLSPAFSADTTSYTVTVPSDTKEVTISASAQSSKATVSVSGGKDLKLGANEAKVIVVAENGSSIAYNITIMCGEVEKIQINGSENTIYESFTDDQIPAGFARRKVTYNQREYEALVNGTGTLQLISLQNESGTAFYIYNQATQEFYTFVQIQIAEGKYIIPLPLSEEVTAFKDYETVTLTVQEKQFDAWKLDEEFSVVYVMNQDGEETLYRYDSVDGTFQRHVDVEVEESEPVDTDRTWFPSEYYVYALIGLVALVAILWITMIYFIASRKHRHEARKIKAVKKAEKQKRKEEKKLEKQRKKEEKAIRGY